MKHINATNLNRNPGERTRISYVTALAAATYAALRKGEPHEIHRSYGF
jgi:hypothetical protein